MMKYKQWSECEGRGAPYRRMMGWMWVTSCRCVSDPGGRGVGVRGGGGEGGR